MDLSEFPSTEAEFRARFANNNQCREYLARLKWPEGYRCVHCSGDRAYFLPSKRVVYECAGCGQQVSLIAGTIFEQSKKPLVLWFRALFEITASKQGISAAELQRKLGLGSYQTAWSWLTKIRTAMVRPNREPLSGEVEIDESYVGGPEPGKPGRRG
jgi:DNA-directed RNA polymerase subunit RPC12/RpoP